MGEWGWSGSWSGSSVRRGCACYGPRLRLRSGERDRLGEERDKGRRCEGLRDQWLERCEGVFDCNIY